MRFITLISTFLTFFTSAKRLNTELCPKLPTSANIEKFTCHRGGCQLKCNRGTEAVGHRRTACKKRGSKGVWTRKIGECKTCTDQNPHSSDPNVVTSCFTNKKHRRTCNIICLNGKFSHEPTHKIRVVCQCNWKG